MCILRIDCPESPDFVIWFLSRVNIDPDCLDVKFSDCYYYCRVLRSRGWRVPPTNGWNIPDVQPGAAAAFSTADEAYLFFDEVGTSLSRRSSAITLFYEQWTWDCTESC
jgi:hypothetical protein